jgi:anti-anti-sigma regulatory factor
MSDLVISVERLPAYGAMLVHPAGPLTWRNRHHLRLEVLKCFAECPTAVILDLSDTTLVDRVAAAMFVALNREAAAGPGITVLICGAAGDLARRLSALEPRRPLYPGRAAAVRAIGGAPEVVDWVDRRLPPEPESTSVAGCLIADACAAWRLPHMIHPARQVMFELVQAAYRCPPETLHVIASLREPQLVLSVRSRIPGPHGPDCAAIPGRTPVRDAGTGLVERPPVAFSRHRLTASGHIGWAWLGTGTA